jgi:hypothetical protein
MALLSPCPARPSLRPTLHRPPVSVGAPTPAGRNASPSICRLIGMLHCARRTGAAEGRLGIGAHVQVSLQVTPASTRSLGQVGRAALAARMDSATAVVAATTAAGLRIGME